MTFVQSTTFPYLILAVEGRRIVKLQRPDVPTAFAAARRLRELGWSVKVIKGKV